MKDEFDESITFIKYSFKFSFCQILICQSCEFDKFSFRQYFQLYRNLNKKLAGVTNHFLDYHGTECNNKERIHVHYNLLGNCEYAQHQQQGIIHTCTYLSIATAMKGFVERPATHDTGFGFCMRNKNIVIRTLKIIKAL